MSNRSPRGWGVAPIVCAGLLAMHASALPVRADQPEPEPPRLSQPPRHPDFFFGRPHGAIGIRGAWLFSSAGSDLYDFVTEQLTLDRGAFNAPSIALDLSITITTRVDLVVGFERSARTTASEYRDFVDNNRLPIEQDTSLRVIDLTASGKVLLASRGRGISRFAWIPNSITPYVGAGAGMLKYEFEQVGDFVDFADLSVFASTFRSEGWTPSGHVLGGVDIRLFRRLYVTGEARYVWASADLERDFVGFDPIDLSGFRCGAGVRLAF
jgi:hypothetical protein